MNKSVQQLVAYFLLLCMSATLIPYNLFHHHEKHSHPADTNIELASDACHISIYHKESQEDQCEHPSHYSDAKDECEFCKIFTTQRHDYTRSSHSSIVPVVIAQDLLIIEGPSLGWNFSNTTLGRAPPIS